MHIRAELHSIPGPHAGQHAFPRAALTAAPAAARPAPNARDPRPFDLRQANATSVMQPSSWRERGDTAEGYLPCMSRAPTLTPAPAYASHGHGPVSLDTAPDDARSRRLPGRMLRWHALRAECR